MRAFVLLSAGLLALPLSGCLGDTGGRAPPLLLSSGLFTFTAVDRDAPGAEPFPDCAALEEDLERRALAQARVALDQGVTQAWGWGGWMVGDAVVAAEASADSAGAPAAGSSARAHSYSAAGAEVTGTNNQEAAADEGDLVKTDGEWTYVVRGGVLHILRSEDVGDVEPHSTMELGQVWGGELLLAKRGPSKADDRLVLVLHGSPPQEEQPFLSDEARSGLAYGGMTRVLVLGLADRRAPEVMEDTWIEGYASGARLVDGHAYVVVQSYEDALGLRTWVGPDEEDLRRLGMDWDDYSRLGEAGQRQVREWSALEADLQNQRRLAETSLDDHLPLVLRGQAGFLFPQPVSGETCTRVLAEPQSTGRAFTTILALDVAGGLQQSTTQVVGASPIVYADSGALVLAGVAQDPWWFWAQPQLEEATDLLWFDLDGLSVTQRAAGRVPGTVLDSFSIDVRGDQLRVATTLGTWGRWWVADPVPMSSQMVVLEETAGALVPTGGVGGIAPGERIWSARFTDERAYLVTFRQTDPLWVIDLTGAPRILGELEIPGVSTYLHPVGEDTLLAIGYGPNADNTNLDWGKVEVSLFDVSDPKRPVRKDVLPLSPPGGYSWSGATGEHRAFTYWESVGTLAVPMTTQHGYERRRADGSYDYVSRQHVGLMLVDVDLDRMELSIKGEVDQDRLVGANQWTNGIERSYFLGYPETGPVSVYAVSSLGVTAHDLETLEDQGWVAFPQEEQSYGYGWD